MVYASLVGLDATPIMANTKQNNPKSFVKNKFSQKIQPQCDSDPDCVLEVHSASNQHNERRYQFYWEYKSHVLVAGRLYLLVASIRADHTSQHYGFHNILAVANQILPLQGVFLSC